MPEAFFVSGRAANACISAQSVTVSSADADFPKDNLQNDKPWKAFRFGSAETNPSIAFDCNMVADPSFETEASGTSLPTTYWSVPAGANTPDISNAQANEGSNSLRLDAASEGAYQDFAVRPGGTYRLTCALYGDGTDPVNAYVLDLISGKWLQSGGTWTTTKTAWATRSTTAFATSSITLTLEDPVLGHFGPAKIRVQFERPGSITGAAYVDSVYLWPKITMAATVFDTIPSAFPVAVESADDSAFSTNLTDNGDLPAWRFRRYLVFAGPATPQRYWRFNVTGSTFAGYLPWVGQTVLAERKTLTRNPGVDYEYLRTFPLVGTEDQPVGTAESTRHQLSAKWKSNTATGLTEMVEQMLASCYYGAEPLLIVPRDDRNTFIYGRGRSLGSISQVELTEGVFQFQIQALDDPYPKQTL